MATATAVSVSLKKQCGEVNVLLGKAMAHQWMPREAVQALSAVGILLSAMVERMEQLEKERHP